VKKKSKNTGIAFGTVDVPPDDVQDFFDWLNDKRGRWLWQIVADDAENARAKTRQVSGSTYNTGKELMIMPQDVLNAMRSENLAAEIAYRNVLAVKDQMADYMRDLTAT